MNAIKKLTAKELTKLMDQAASELANRKRIETFKQRHSESTGQA